ncbi:MAG TPA: lytic transglycosylase domain-containing protein [Polyangiaceae bacterium]|nr:lytic transglycosylase domain-containing protein [Polyangiaceae bacterium]
MSRDAATFWRQRTALVLAALASLPLLASARIERSVDQHGVITLGQSRTFARSTATRDRNRSNQQESQPMVVAQTSVPNQRFDQHIRDAARLYQIPEELVRAVIMVESGFSPRAVSPANAKGLMQLIPATAQRMQVEDIFDPRQNIYGGVRYLRVLANLFNGDLALTIAAYNAGEGAVLRYGGIPPYRETEDYVTRVIGLFRKYRAERQQ